MNIVKSSRHSKITGDFAEALVLYWLSKYGFECARVDHTGIDLIARNPHTHERLGISVKSRCRTIGRETSHILIPCDNFTKAKAACDAFGCTPYIAIVVDAAELVRGFILPMSHLMTLCPPAQSGNCHWSMSARSMATCASDPQVKTFELHARTTRWWEKD